MVHVRFGVFSVQKCILVRDSTNACLGALVLVKFNLIPSYLKRAKFGMGSHAPGQ